MNLGVETDGRAALPLSIQDVSAFSDESWGGDQKQGFATIGYTKFQHSLMNLGVETPNLWTMAAQISCFSIL